MSWNLIEPTLIEWLFCRPDQHFWPHLPSYTWREGAEYAFQTKGNTELGHNPFPHHKYRKTYVFTISLGCQYMLAFVDLFQSGKLILMFFSPTLLHSCQNSATSCSRSNMTNHSLITHMKRNNVDFVVDIIDHLCSFIQVLNDFLFIISCINFSSSSNFRLRLSPMISTNAGYIPTKLGPKFCFLWPDFLFFSCSYVRDTGSGWRFGCYLVTFNLGWMFCDLIYIYSISSLIHCLLPIIVFTILE